MSAVMGTKTQISKVQQQSLWLSRKCPNAHFGYFVLVASVLGQTAGCPGQGPMIGAFVNAMMENLELSRTEISLVFLFSAASAALVQPIFGVFVDRAGVCISGIVSVVCLAISCYAISFVHDRYTLFVGYFLLRFFGTGAVVISCQKVLNLWFVSQRGRYSGLVNALRALIAVGVVPSLSHHFIGIIGWRNTYIMAGNIILLVTPVIGMFFREAPETYGLLPDGKRLTTTITTTKTKATSKTASSATTTTATTVSMAKYLPTRLRQSGLSTGDSSSTIDIELPVHVKAKTSLLHRHSLPSDAPLPNKKQNKTKQHSDTDDNTINNNHDYNDAHDLNNSNNNNNNNNNNDINDNDNNTTTPTTSNEPNTTHTITLISHSSNNNNNNNNTANTNTTTTTNTNNETEEMLPKTAFYEEFVWTRAMAVRTPAFWVMTVGVQILWAIASAIFFWLTPLLTEAHVHATFISVFYLTLAIAQMIFGILTGVLIDKISPHHILAAALAVQFVNLLLLARFLNTTTAHIVAFLQGIINCVGNNVMAVVCAQYFGRSHLGAISGLALSITVMGTAFGPFPVGLMSDVLGGFQIAFLMMAGFPLVWIVVTLMCGSKPVHVGAIAAAAIAAGGGGGGVSSSGGVSGGGGGGGKKEGGAVNGGVGVDGVGVTVVVIGGGQGGSV